MNIINLEPRAAEAAQYMVMPNQAKESFILINKALMVLAEQGLFAFGLFLNSRKDKEKDLAQQIHTGVSRLLEQAGLAAASQPGHQPPMADYYKALTETGAKEQSVQALQRLILTKQVVETALTYGRYQAKSLT